MARIRTIKPEFPQSESMGRVSRDARLCFIMLWTISDDYGRLRGNSRMLASLLYPYDEDAGKRIEGWLTELVNEGCILRYADGGDSYIQIINWEHHQRVDKPSKSKIPLPREDSCSVREDSRESREASCEDQGPRTKEGTKDQRRRVTLDNLSAGHIADWLIEKRKSGKYINHDEHFILEQFKDYCRSKGKTYSDYVAGYRNAFEWERCQPKGRPVANADGFTGL